MKKILIWLFFWLNLAAIIGLWWWQSGAYAGVSWAYNFKLAGRIAALLAVYFILWEFWLIGRVKPLEQSFGQDKLARWHHWTGILALLFIILHPLFTGLGYALSFGRSLPTQMIAFLNWEEMLPAYLAVAAFLIVVILSLAIIKRHLKYELWFYVHLAVYLGIIWAFGHQLVYGWDLQNKTGATYWLSLYWVFIGVFVWYRFIMPLYNFWRFRFQVTKVVSEGNNVWSVYIGGRNMAKFKARAGQFLLVRYLNKYCWQSHPFSLSAAPDGKSLRITVKALGDFTNNLDQKIKPGTFVWVEGPLGIFTLDKAVTNKFLFIAGGVGITPIRAMMEETADKQLDVILLCANRRPEDMIFNDELAQLREKACGKTRCAFVYSDAGVEVDEKGRIDEERLKRLVPDIAERDVYFCGPPPMAKSLIPAFARLGVPEKQIHFEKFSF
ncbi:MAG: ferredoxin reductase family protein [Candidatus Falkowbacteria bacterium]